MNDKSPKTNIAGNDPLVSIVVITYNQELYIEAAVASCLSQSYANIEVIVSDDASTDKTVEIVRSLAAGDPRVKLLEAETNRGITGNVRTAYQNCRGKYIAFLGGDDILYPEKIATQVKCMESDLELALTFTQCHIVFNEDLTPVRTTAGTAASDVNDGYELAGTFAVEIPGPAPMVRASMAPEGGFRSLAPVASDWLFFIETCYRHRCKLIQTPLAAYRMHDNNIGKKRYNYIKDYISSYEFIANTVPYCNDARFVKQVRGALQRYLLGTYYASVIDGRKDVAAQVAQIYRGIWGSCSLYLAMRLGQSANLSTFFSRVKPMIKKFV
jgi:glycosyltransferase involved in cell wall biosynthesis